MTEFSPVYFDPLSTSDLTALICRKFEEQADIPLSDVHQFDGSGLYAIYYTGDATRLYRPLSGYLIPVYVGSAQSHNSATGLGTAKRRPLYSRVRSHRRSIEQSDLTMAEFTVRLLLMPDVHIDLGENGLRVGYKPVWNSLLRGFGSNEQGHGTRASKQTVWDAVHNGRSRSYGSLRDDADLFIREAQRAIGNQVAACGPRKSLDWNEPNHAVVEFRPFDELFWSRASPPLAESLERWYKDNS